MTKTSKMAKRETKGLTDEAAVKRRELRRLERRGAILDESLCGKAREGYWHDMPWFREHSKEWRQCFMSAAVLASGLRLFSGGYFTHKCGDPESRWNLRHALAEKFGYFVVPGAEAPEEFGPEAVRIFHRNIRRGIPYLKTMYGEQSPLIEDGLAGIRAAAEIFGIPLD